MHALAGIVLVVACLVLAVPAAEASFPGRNGSIAISRFGPSDELTIWLVDPRSGRAQQLTRAPRHCMREAAGWEDTDPSFSPSGRLIAYYHQDDCDPRIRAGIYLIRADGRMPPRRVPVSPLRGFPAFSPSGKRLASDWAGSIFITTLDRPKRKRELSDPRDRQWSAPSWGATGRLALTVGGLTGPVGHIATMRPDGSDLQLITRSRRDSLPDWSPHGDRVVFFRTKEWGQVGPTNGDILIAPARADPGQPPTRLTHTRNAIAPAWSPNGRAIAFIRTTRKGRYDPHLAIMRANGDRQRRLAIDKVNPFDRISWQPRPQR